MKKRVEILENAMSVETGGDYEFAPEGDPWEVEVIYDKRMSLFAFLLGMLVGASIVLALML